MKSRHKLEDTYIHTYLNNAMVTGCMTDFIPVPFGKIKTCSSDVYNACTVLISWNVIIISVITIRKASVCSYYT